MLSADRARQYSHRTKSSRPALPVAPAGLSATAGDLRVDLQRNKNSEPDIFEYVVYRSLVDSVLIFFDSLGRTSASDTVFVDSTVVNHKTYFYRVAAVDTNFNRSDFSQQASATPFLLPLRKILPHKAATGRRY